jgi:hypothetical protein
MSYQTGTASSPTNLLQTLVTWLVSIGWTQDRSATEGSGWTATLHKSANYVNIRAAMNENTIWHQDSRDSGYGLHMYLGTGYASGNSFNNQAGGPIGSSTFPVGVGMHLSAGPFTNYYFFADSGGDNVVVVVEKTPGLYVHIGWGLSIQKAGAFTGGPYFFGSTCGYNTNNTLQFPNSGPGYTTTSDCPFVNQGGGGGCGFVRADVDSFVGKWIGIFNSSNPALADAGFTGKRGNSSVRGTNCTMDSNYPVYAYNTGQFQDHQTSLQDGRANLLPILLWVNRDGTATGYSLMGTPPNIFSQNAIGNGFSNAAEYVLGVTTYKLFPNFAVVKQ